MPIMYGQISRVQFESLLRVRLEKMRHGLFRAAKNELGPSWDSTIDFMYQNEAGRLSANRFAEATEQCAIRIRAFVDSAKPEKSVPYRRPDRSL
jgi:hypothetical protein